MSDESSGEEETASAAAKYAEPIRICSSQHPDDNDVIWKFCCLLIQNTRSLGIDEEHTAVILSVIVQTLGHDSNKLFDLLIDTGGATPITLDILLEDTNLFRLSPKQIIVLLRHSANENAEKILEHLDGALENALDISDEDTLDAVSQEYQVSLHCMITTPSPHSSSRFSVWVLPLGFISVFRKWYASTPEASKIAATSSTHFRRS